MDKVKKSKLVFFRFTREGLPRYIRLHAEDHIKCLSHFFEVTVVNYDCDYGEICESASPDITLFESGVYVGKRRRITNTSAHPEIPKLGFLNSDAYCETREVFISDMARWGVQTFFTLSVSMGEYFPEISNRLFVWPNFADPAVYHDYGIHKTIPILLTGSRKGHYPWRNRVANILSQHYPTLNSPHFGWFNEGETARMTFGDEYARMINAACFVPTCGTIAREIVRKHFEIPAARACLVTEKTAATQAAGFVDGENCIYADGSDVLDKVDYFFERREELERITAAGHALAHLRHTPKQRGQVLQWHTLSKNLKPNQRIVQPDPFQPLLVVEESSPIQNGHCIGPGLDRMLLRDGDQKLWGGRFDEAEESYIKCLNYQSSMPEPKLRMALCNLAKGKADRALYWVTQPLKRMLEVYEAEPDPVEWTYFIVTLLCQGNRQEATRRGCQFLSLRHPELDRTRLVLDFLNGSRIDGVQTPSGPAYRSSIHQLPTRTWSDWIRFLCSLLKACQQSGTAAEVIKMASLREPSFVPDGLDRGRSEEAPRHNVCDGSARIDLPSTELSSQNVLPLRAETPLGVFRRRVKRLFKVLLADPLRTLESRFGYFLPYRYSTMRQDEFLSVVRNLAKNADVKTGLIVGASAGRGSTEAFLAGTRENANKPVIYSLNASGTSISNLKERPDHDKRVKIDADATPDSLFGNFGVVLIAASELPTTYSFDDRYKGEFIILNDVNTLPGHQIYQILLKDEDYRLIKSNPDHLKGYAIFQR